MESKEWITLSHNTIPIAFVRGNPEDVWSLASFPFKASALSFSLLNKQATSVSDLWDPGICAGQTFSIGSQDTLI